MLESSLSTQYLGLQTCSSATYKCHLPFHLHSCNHVQSALFSHCSSPDQACDWFHLKNVLPTFIRLVFMLFSKGLSCSLFCAEQFSFIQRPSTCLRKQFSQINIVPNQKRLCTQSRVVEIAKCVRCHDLKCTTAPSDTSHFSQPLLQLPFSLGSVAADVVVSSPHSLWSYLWRQNREVQFGICGVHGFIYKCKHFYCTVSVLSSVFPPKL